MLKIKTPLSYSRINTYRSCPLMYKFRYISKLPETPSAPLILGAVLHDFFEVYAKHCQATKQESDLSAVEKIQKQVLENQKNPLPDNLIEIFNKLSLKFAEIELLEADRLYSIEEEAAFDKDWKPTNWMAEDVAFRMKMDRLYLNNQEGEAIIRDYKTGYGEGDKFQMRCYAVGVFNLLSHIKTCWTEFFYVPTAYLARTKFTREDLPEFIKEIKNKCEKIFEDKEYKPTPGPACQYCSFVKRCKAVPSDLLVIENTDDAKKIATDLFLLEGQIKAKKQALKSYVKKHGDIETETGRWGFKQSEVFKVDNIVDIINAMLKRNIDPNQYLTLSATDIKHLSKKDKTFLDDIQNALRTDVIESFRAMKLKSEEVE